MTHITLPRAVVEQALEALENAEDHLAKPYSTDASEAIAALRAALAQQAEPVADPFNCPKCGRHDYGMHGACPTCDAQQAEPWERRVALAEQLQMQQAEPLTIERLRDALVASRIIQPAAVEDPEEYDDGVTLHRIEALHRRIA